MLRGDLLELEGKQLEYVAPEVLVRTQKGADTGFPVVAHKVDVWSAGGGPQAALCRSCKEAFCADCHAMSCCQD